MTIPSLLPMRSTRSASLAITLLSVILHLALAIRLISSWRSLKSEPESEWEGSTRVDGLKLIWGLLSAYFVAASAVSFIGFIGVIKVIFILNSLFSHSHLPPPPLEQTILRPFLSRFIHSRFRFHRIRYYNCSL